MGSEMCIRDSCPSAQTLSTHDGEVYALATHAAVVASAGADQRVRFWAKDSLSPEGALPPSTHQASVFALATIAPAAPSYSAVSGSAPVFLASADAHGEVVLSDFAERAPVRRLSSGGSAICALLSTVAGRLHAASGRGRRGAQGCDSGHRRAGGSRDARPGQQGRPGAMKLRISVLRSPCLLYTSPSPRDS